MKSDRSPTAGRDTMMRGGTSPADLRPLINFAYGSNMLARRLAQRVPGARCLGLAVLPEGTYLRIASRSDG